MSWKAEVIADGSGKWVHNDLRFATRQEAEAYAADLDWRWTMVLKTRAVECDDPVTHCWDGARAIASPLP